MLRPSDLAGQMTVMRLNETEFHDLMTEIDNELAAKGFAIFQREIQALGSLAMKQNIAVDFAGPVAKRVTKWMRERYGDRLNFDPDIGAAPVLIGGDIYKLRIPLIVGRVYLTTDPATFSSKSGSDINLLSLVLGLTAVRAQTLTDDERAEIEGAFRVSFKLFSALAGVNDQLPFVREAKEDLKSAMSRLCAERASYGLANWDLLQAVEKFLKAFIQAKGSKPPRTHKLRQLATEAEALGLGTLSVADLNLVQCEAEVRYDTASVTKVYAVRAYYAALGLCAVTGKELSSKKVPPMGQKDRP